MKIKLTDLITIVLLLTLVSALSGSMLKPKNLGVNNVQKVLADFENNDKTENKKYPEIKKDNTQKLDISAEAYLAIYTDNNQKTILAEKNTDKELLIASITKLMTATVASDYYRRNSKIFFDQEAFDWSGTHKLAVGDILSFENALKTMLVESNNDIARAIAFNVGKEDFVSSMNKKARELLMFNTHYTNSSGLDEEISPFISNYSTANDLLLLVSYLIDKRPEIISATSLQEFNLYDVNNLFKYTAITTNQFLKDNILPFDVIGGKTGQTDKANKNLILIMRSPKKDGYVIAIILNSNNNFEDMKKLINWSRDTYEW